MHNKIVWLCCCLLSGFAVFMTGCATKVAVPAPVYDARKPEIAPVPERPEVPVHKPESVPPVPKPKPPTPQELASLQLCDQGRRLLKEGRVDEAISVLERAVGLNPNDGQNYYYLAEAWIVKGDMRQASEFNRLAGLYLRQDAGWMRRVSEQWKRIQQ